MRIAVIGGAGYIGSHVALALTDAGHTPVVFDNLRTGRREHLRFEHEFILGDIRNTEDLNVLFSTDIDAVIHLAALKSVGASMRDPYAYSDVNVTGTIRLLEAMGRHSVDRIVFSSSAAVYGSPKKLPFTEDHPLAPESYYGQTKAWVEAMLAWHARLSGLASVSLRYFNAVGCDSRLRIREREPENLFPILLEAAAQEREGVTIFGDDYETADGTCVRDYVHVNDLADAHVRALEHLSNEGSHVFNLGTGAGLSVRECVDAARTLFTEFDVRIGPRRAGDPATIYADSRRAERELGWQAKNTDVHEMLASMAPAYGLEVRR
ncbi:MAG: UDP-glucose 4-epimerase GalE [Candidatus Woesearchaeota archaeon]